MTKVSGIGGIFFKAKDTSKMKTWYEQNLGIKFEGGAASFLWRDKEKPDHIGRTVWSLFPEDTKYFEPGKSTFMINYRVENLDEIIKQLNTAGIKLEGVVEDYDYGRFAWITDPEGNKIELWEPKGEEE